MDPPPEKKQPLAAPSEVKRYFVSPEESGQECGLVLGWADCLAASLAKFLTVMRRAEAA